MSDELLEELAELHDELDAAFQSMAAIANPMPAQGSDNTGILTVSIGSDGRVERVDVAENWQRGLTGNGVGRAVWQAWESARTAQLQQWDDSSDEQIQRAREPRPRALPLPHEGLGYQLSAISAPHIGEERMRIVCEELIDLMNTVSRATEDLANMMPARLASSHTGRSGNRCVSVTVNGAGELVDLTCHCGRLVGEQKRRIGQYITEAFSAAYRSLDSTRVAEMSLAVSAPR